MKPRRTHLPIHKNPEHQNKSLKKKISYERRRGQKKKTVNSLLFSLQTNNKHNNREIYQSINLSLSLSLSLSLVITRCCYIRAGSVPLLLPWHFAEANAFRKFRKLFPTRQKETGTKKEKKQNRTEEDDAAAAARERCEKRVRGCEGMEALETILGSLVQSKKTQRQDSKSS
jgi:hypothetical protein